MEHLFEPACNHLVMHWESLQRLSCHCSVLRHLQPRLATFECSSTGKSLALPIDRQDLGSLHDVLERPRDCGQKKVGGSPEALAVSSPQALFWQKVHRREILHDEKGHSADTECAAASSWPVALYLLRSWIHAHWNL